MGKVFFKINLRKNVKNAFNEQTAQGQGAGGGKELDEGLSVGLDFFPAFRVLGRMDVKTGAAKKMNIWGSGKRK
jgi:hypothetical protein